MMNFMQRNTYAPRTEVGQQRAEQIGEFANRNLVPIAPMLEGLALPLTAGSRAKYNPTASRAVMEQIVPNSVNQKIMGQTPKPSSLLEDFVDFGKPVPAEKNNTVTLRHNTSGKEIEVTKEAAKTPFYKKEWSPLDPYVAQADNHFNEFSKMYTSFTDPKSPFFTDGGRINSTDNWREVFPVYRENRNKSALVHEGASELSKKWYAKKLSEPVPEGFDNAVLFTAGGTGAGKTSAIQESPILKPLADKANIIYDTNMNGLKSSVKKINQALDANRDVDIVYTYRDPEDALRQGALTRAMKMERNHKSGRTVPLNEHLKTHIGSYDTMFKLQEMYKDDPRVSIRAIDNSFGKGQSKVVPLDKIPKINENEVSPRLNRALEEEYQSGRISKNIYEATKVQ
jgi:hypothetical protein